MQQEVYAFADLVRIIFSGRMETSTSASAHTHARISVIGGQAPHFQTPGIKIRKL